MQAKTTLFGLVVALLAVAMWMPGAVAGDGDSDGSAALMAENDTPFGFGMRIAGTYFSNAGFGGTLTLHADGTVVALSGQCCGNATNIQSESYGNWVRTGPHQIELRTVAIGTLHDFSNMDPTLQGPSGNFMATPSAILDFTMDYESFEGQLCTSVWFFELGGPGVMPDVEVDPPAVVLGPFPYDMTRLSVFVECPASTR